MSKSVKYVYLYNLFFNRLFHQNIEAVVVFGLESSRLVEIPTLREYEISQIK